MKYDIPPATGAILGDLSVLHWSSMTLASDMKTMSMHYISYKHCASTMKPSPSIGGDYQQRTCELSMPGYVQQAVEKFQHGIMSTIKAVDAPHPYKATKKHGLPMTQPHDAAAKLTPQVIRHLQQIMGTFLFYSRAIDPTMLTALSIIATEQTQGTQT